MEEEIDKQEFLNSKEGVATVLLSPRVQEIPKPNIITVAVSLFILLGAGVAVFVIPKLIGNVERKSIFFPIQEAGDGLTCDSVEIRELQNFQLQSLEDNDINTSLALTFNTIRLDVFKPELFVETSLALTDDEILDFFQVMDDLKENDTFIPQFNEDFETAFENISFIEVVNNTILEITVGDVFCVVDFNKVIRKIVSVCEQIDVFRLEAKILVDTKFDEDSQRTVAEVLIPLFVNFHVPSNKWDDLLGLYSPSRLDEIDPNFATREVSLLDVGLSNKNAFCTEEATGDLFTDFGLYSGFGFLFEGIITFVFAVTIFRGRLGLENPLEEENVFVANHHLHVMSPKEIEAAENGSENSESKALRYSAAKLVYAHHGKNVVHVEDLQRAIHNPRVKFLNYAGTISLLSSIVFFALTAIFALIAQDAQKREVCTFVPFDKLSNTENCDALAFTQSFLLNVDEDTRGTEFDVGVIRADIFLNINDMTGINSTDNPLFNENVTEALDEFCPDGQVDLSKDSDRLCLFGVFTFEPDILFDPDYFDVGPSEDYADFYDYVEDYEPDFYDYVEDYEPDFYDYVEDYEPDFYDYAEDYEPGYYYDNNFTDYDFYYPFDYDFYYNFSGYLKNYDPYDPYVYYSYDQYDPYVYDPVLGYYNYDPYDPDVYNSTDDYYFNPDNYDFYDNSTDDYYFNSDNYDFYDNSTDDYYFNPDNYDDYYFNPYNYDDYYFNPYNYDDYYFNPDNYYFYDSYYYYGYDFYFDYYYYGFFFDFDYYFYGFYYFDDEDLANIDQEAVTVRDELYTFEFDDLTGSISITRDAFVLTTALVASNDQLSYQVVSDFEIDPASNIRVDNHSSTYLRSLYQQTFSEPTIVFDSFSETTGTCCSVKVKFNYFEYFGIMLAYMIFLEGFIVLCIAILVLQCCGSKEEQKQEETLSTIEVVE